MKFHYYDHTKDIFYVHIICLFDYRSRATTGRSRLVAAPLRFQAKNSFLCSFYAVIWRPKSAIFDLKPRPVVARLR